MKKLILLSGLITMLAAADASARTNVDVVIGAPVIAAPPPVVYTAPYPYPVAAPYPYYYYDRHHHYNWNRWHDRDRDWDRHDNGRWHH